MKVNPKLIEDTIAEVAGPETIPLYKYLINKKNVSEFKIAEVLKITVNQVRNILYKLGNYNLVNSIRKKDKKKGWYIYYWTLNPREALNLLLKLKNQKIETLNKKLERETQTKFFVCPNKDIRMHHEMALEYNFKCPECGSLLVEDDNRKEIESIKRQIEMLHKLHEEKYIVNKIKVKKILKKPKPIKIIKKYKKIIKKIKKKKR